MNNERGMRQYYFLTNAIPLIILLSPSERRLFHQEVTLQPFNGNIITQRYY